MNSKTWTLAKKFQVIWWKNKETVFSFGYLKSGNRVIEHLGERRPLHYVLNLFSLSPPDAHIAPTFFMSLMAFFSSYSYFNMLSKWKLFSNGTMAYWLGHWISKPEVMVSKPLGGSQVNSVFHPSKVDQMSTKNSWRHW